MDVGAVEEEGEAEEEEEEMAQMEGTSPATE